MIGSVQWEYTEVTGATINIDAWVLQLNGLGSLGWEVVGITAVDPTIGLNSYTALLKRQVLDWPAPATAAADWYPDPTGRFVVRYWDGLRWTQHVTDPAGDPATDYPNRRT